MVIDSARTGHWATAHGSICLAGTQNKLHTTAEINLSSMGLKSLIFVYGTLSR